LPASAVLEVRGLTKRFGGVVAVNNVDLAIAGGTIHSVIGPNGAGKTTVFNCIMQILQPSSGQIWFGGLRLDGLTPDRVAAAGLSRTYQNIRLFKGISALDNVLVGMHLHLRARWWGAVLNTRHTRRLEQQARERARELLSFVGLQNEEEKLAGTLAYGQQRRLEIARALAVEPRLLMLDEPMAGMNPRESGEMMVLIQRIRDGFQTAIMLIEHQMRVVMDLSDVVTVLDHGVKIAEGAPAEIQKDERVIEAYLGRKTAAAQPRITEPAGEAPTILSVDGIRVFYDRIEAIKGVSLAVGQQQIVTLIGANGAGKTTTLKALSGLLPLAGGEVRLNGVDLAGLRAHQIAASGVVQVPEGRRIFGRLSVRENLQMGGFTRRDRRRLAAKEEELLMLFPRLRERLHQVAGTLSGGEQQMVAMARALMAEPKILLLDEPSMGLSPMMVDQVFQTIRDINARGVAILLVEQNAHLALSLADHAYVLEGGRVVLSGSGAELLGHEQVQRAYLG
jgi:ABC-type branched-subunit amino acid transport system ATPase component